VRGGANSGAEPWGRARRGESLRRASLARPKRGSEPAVWRDKTRSGRIMEDHTQSKARPGSDAADAMAYRGSVHAARAPSGPESVGEHEALSLVPGDGLSTGLSAGSLLHEQELATRVVTPHLTEENDKLEGESDGSVEVLVKTVIPPDVIAQEKGRGTPLSDLVALFFKESMAIGEVLRHSQGLHPTIADLCQRWVTVGSKLAYEPRQRRGEILIVADAKAVTLHIDMAAEMGIAPIESRKPHALVGRKNARESGIGPLSKLLVNPVPVQPRHALGDALPDHQASHLHDNGFGGRDTIRFRLVDPWGIAAPRAFEDLSVRAGLWQARWSSRRPDRTGLLDADQVVCGRDERSARDLGEDARGESTFSLHLGPDLPVSGRMGSGDSLRLSRRDYRGEALPSVVLSRSPGDSRCSAWIRP